MKITQVITEDGRIMFAFHAFFPHYLIFRVMCLSERSRCQFSKGKSKGNNIENYKPQSTERSQKDGVRGGEALQATAGARSPVGPGDVPGVPSGAAVPSARCSAPAQAPASGAPFLLVTNSVMSC